VDGIQNDKAWGLWYAYDDRPEAQTVAPAPTPQNDCGSLSKKKCKKCSRLQVNAQITLIFKA